MQSFTPNNSSKMMNREVFKIILMGLMVLDHISYFISPYLADIFHLITRVVAVGFAYLVVEGLYYTHSRKNYIGRLVGWGIFMSLGNCLMNLFVLRKQFAMSIIGDNIFLTLALGAIVIYLWDNHSEDEKRQKLLKILAIILMIITLLPLAEGSFVIVPFMFITQLTHNDPKKRDISYLCLMLILMLIELPMALSIPNITPLMLFDSVAMNASDICFILIIPFLYLYNGKQSQYSKKLKYLFYIFYPMHLWIIHLIASMML